MKTDTNLLSQTDKSNRTTKLTPRHTRTIQALLTTEWVWREEVDRIAGASNGPQVIAELRRKLTGSDGIDMELVAKIDRDGRACRPGRYRLNELGRERLLKQGVLNG